MSKFVVVTKLLVGTGVVVVAELADSVEDH